MDVTPAGLVVDISGWDALWALSRGFTVPLSGIRNAMVLDRAQAGKPPALRWPGTALPGVVVAGTYVWRSRREFWVTYRADRFLVVTCAPGSPYDRLVLQTGEPERDAAMILAALR